MIVASTFARTFSLISAFTARSVSEVRTAVGPTSARTVWSNAFTPTEAETLAGMAFPSMPMKKEPVRTANRVFGSWVTFPAIQSDRVGKPPIPAVAITVFLASSPA